LRRDIEPLNERLTRTEQERDEAMQFATEHIRKVDANTLENRMTIVDPLRFTRPWELTIRYTRAVGLDRLIQYGCEDDRHPLVDGKLVVAPP